jgi:hypothetical protein
MPITTNAIRDGNSENAWIAYGSRSNLKLGRGIALCMHDGEHLF